MLKHRGLLFCLTAVLGLMLSSCEGENVIGDLPGQLIVPEEFTQLIDSGIDFGALDESGEIGISGPVSKMLTFNATSDWSAEITDTKSSAWLSVEPAAGGPGKVDMVVTAQPNTSEDPRSASVTIMCGSVSVSFDVRQAGAPPVVEEYVFEIAPTSVSLEADGGSFEVAVTCTGEYHVESMPEWVEQLGVADKVHRFSAGANPSEAERRGVIVFCDNEGTCLPCSIKQEGAEPEPPAPELALSDEYLTFTSEEGSIEVTVTSNVEWIASSDQDWCQVAPTSGSGDAQISVRVSANPTEQERSATITVSTADNSISHSVTVMQQGAEPEPPAPELVLSDANLTFTSEEGSLEISVTSNVEWVASSDQDWCQVAPTSGSGNAQISVSVSANPTEQERSATITVSTADNSISHSVSVTQEGAEPEPPAPELVISDSYISFASEGGNLQIDVTSNVEWVASSNQGWCQINPTSGSGNGQIAVSASANPTEEVRSATITVSTADNSISHSVTVMQEGAEPEPPAPELVISDSFIPFASEGGNSQIAVSSNVEWIASSDHDWCQINPASGSGNGQIAVSVTANSSEQARSATITVSTADYSISRTVTVSQEGAEPAQPDFDWSQEFFHRSLFMRFTATWCGWCPFMAKAVHLTQTNHPDKLECINLHASGSDLYFSGTSALGSQYGITGYPTGIVDGRRRQGNYTDLSYASSLIEQRMAETEANYPVASAIGIQSSFSGQTLNIDVDLYLRVAASWKVTVVVSESNIIGYQADNGEGAHNDYVHNDVARIAVTSMTGDEFTSTEAQTIKSFNYSVSIPTEYVKNNLKVLVYVQREYGSQTVLRDGSYGDYYVDNCASGKAGTTVAPAIVSSGSGDNEGFDNGDPINW